MTDRDHDYPEGIAGEIAQHYREARDHWSAWREEARECQQFYAGLQWAEDDVQRLQEAGRPVITFNRIAPLVDAVLGHEANNRAEIRYIPRTQGDASVNEGLTNASAYFRDQCDAEHEESDAFRDTMITGIGWTQIRLSDERNPEYDLVDERVDPLEMLPDPRARKPNFADARWHIREKRMSKEEIAEMWPDYEVTDSQPSWAMGSADGEGAINTNKRDAYRSSGGGEDQSKRGYLVLEYQYRCVDTFWAITRADGEAITIDQDQYDERKDQIEEMRAGGAKVESKRRTVWKRCFQIGDDIVQEDAPWPESCTYTAITGKRDSAAGTWFGIVRSLLDPQRWANKWLSQALHVYNSNAKGGVMLEQSAAANQADFEAKWTDPAGIVWLNDGALSKGQVQPKPAATAITGAEKFLEIAIRSFSEVSGVNAEILGLADREQPGVLEYQRKQSAVTLLAPLFDSLRRYRKIKGRTWLYGITHYVSDGRLVRMTIDAPQQPQMPQAPGQPQQMTQQERWVPLIRDESVTEYDVIVDQSSSAPNVKEQTWGVLQQLAPVLMKAGMPPSMMLTLLEYSPLPASLVEELRAEMQKMAQQPQKSPAQMEAEANIQAKQMEMQADQQMAQAKLQAELQLQQQKLAGEMEIKRAQAAADLNLEREKALLQAQTQIETTKIAAGVDGQVAMVNADAEAERHQIAQRGDQDRTDRLGGVMEALAASQAQLAQSVSALAEAQMAESETTIGKAPDGSKTARTRKLRRAA